MKKEMRQGGMPMKKYPAVLAIFILVLLIPVLSASALCVRVSKANLRKGPGKKYEAAWQVYMYMPLERIGRSTNKYWYAVRDADGDTFWVHKGLVTDSYRCAVVNVEKANVRKGPGKNTQPWRTVPLRSIIHIRSYQGKRTGSR